VSSLTANRPDTVNNVWHLDEAFAIEPPSLKVRNISALRSLPHRSLRSVAVLTLFVLTSGILCAQEYNSARLRGHRRPQQPRDPKIYQDHVGFVWVSTENGIYRLTEKDSIHLTGAGIPSTSGAPFGDARMDLLCWFGGDSDFISFFWVAASETSSHFKNCQWAQVSSRMGVGTRIIARIPVLWSAIPIRA